MTNLQDASRSLNEMKEALKRKREEIATKEYIPEETTMLKETSKPTGTVIEFDDKTEEKAAEVIRKQQEETIAKFKRYRENKLKFRLEKIAGVYNLRHKKFVFWLLKKRMEQDEIILSNFEARRKMATLTICFKIFKLNYLNARVTKKQAEMDKEKKIAEQEREKVLNRLLSYSNILLMLDAHCI